MSVEGLPDTVPCAATLDVFDPLSDLPARFGFEALTSNDASTPTTDRRLVGSIYLTRVPPGFFTAADGVEQGVSYLSVEIGGEPFQLSKDSVQLNIDSIGPPAPRGTVHGCLQATLTGRTSGRNIGIDARF